MSKKVLEVIPLGGYSEIGKNITALRYKNEIMVIDAGLAFPESDMLGVDILVPKIDYLLEHAREIRGMVLTHGHEDHIGALPYLVPRLPRFPIYGARLTLGLLRGKFEEFRITDADVDLFEMALDQPFPIGSCFTVLPFRSTHSIPDNAGLIIETPVGRVVHSGDFKIDPTPVDGLTSSLHKVLEAGEKGVLLLISDSTRIESPGFTPSERTVGETFDQIINHAPGRVFIACFASHIHRLQLAIDASERYGRQVAVDGRSMWQTTRIAAELGYLRSQQPLVPVDQLGDVPHNQLTVLCTGAQGQPLSVLHRLALGTHAKIRIEPSDTIILSSSPIPGNEEAVGRVINGLFGLGARVFYRPLHHVHVSGHGSKEELRMLLNFTKPRFFMPFHGETRHQVLHKELAESIPSGPRQTVIVGPGDKVELTEDNIKVVGTVEAGWQVVDGLGVGDVSEIVLRDRQSMSSDGIIVIIAMPGKKPSVEVVSRGFVHPGQELLREIERISLEALKNEAQRNSRSRPEDLKEAIYQPVRRFIRRETGRQPMIIPTVINGGVT